MRSGADQNRADALRTRLGSLSGDQKEVTIIEELSNALREMGGRYVLPFRFRNAAGNRTTHPRSEEMASCSKLNPFNFADCHLVLGPVVELSGPGRLMRAPRSLRGNSCAARGFKPKGFTLMKERRLCIRC